MGREPRWPNTQENKSSGLVLLFLGLGMAIVAQVVLCFSVRGGDVSEYFKVSHWLQNSWNDTSPVPGIFLYLVAGGLFFLGLKLRGDAQPALTIQTGRAKQREPRFGFWITSLGASIMASLYFVVKKTEYLEHGDISDPLAYVVFAMWVIGIVLFVLSVLRDVDWQPASVSQVRAWIMGRRGEFLVLAALLVAAFVIRVLDLEYHPYSFINDEARVGQAGLCLLHGGCSNLFFMEGWSGQPYLAFLPYALGVALFGKTAIALRIVSAVLGTLSIPAVYLFAREAFGKKIAWASAALLVALPLHIQFSRLGVDNIADSLSAPLVLWLLIRGAKRGSTVSFVAAGLIAGLCVYTYPGSVLTPLLGTGILVVIAVQNRGFLQAQGRNMLFAVLAAAMAAIPVLGNFYLNPNLFMARFQGAGIFLNGTLQSQSAPGLGSTAKYMIDQFARSSLVSIVTAAQTGFFNSPAPYLIPLVATLFVLGMFVVVWHIKDPRYAMLFVMFWAPVILGSTLTSSPPSSQRMLMTTPALVIIALIGVMKIIESVHALWPNVERFVPVILLGLVIYAGLTNLNFYFGEYRTGHYFEDPANEFTYETHTDIAPLHERGRLYLIDDPSVLYLSFPSFDYLAPDVEKSEFDTVTRETLAALPRDEDALFIATPDYKIDLQKIVQWIPGGEWKEATRRYQPTQVLYYSYKLTKEQLEGFAP
jgi:4-amino-4-deoxy-L-arabinose transferase-like glycosyltransferase